MQTIKVLTQHFNKSQVRKGKAVNALLEAVSYENCCNGNSGYSDSEMHMLFGKQAFFGNLTVKKVNGCPVATGHYTLNAALMSSEQLLVAEAITSSGSLKSWFQNKPRGISYAIPKA